MADAFDQRLRAWKNDTEGRLARKWYLWPILIVTELVADQLKKSTSDFVIECRTEISNFMEPIIGRTLSNPVVLAALVAILIFVVLFVHSYFDSLPKPAVKSTVPLTVFDVIFERSTRSDVVYKSKVRIILRNDTGQLISASLPNWRSEKGDIPIEWPQGSTLQLEGPGGWQKEGWQPGAKNLGVPQGRVFRFWIGLPPSVGDDELVRRHQSQRLGIIELPVIIQEHEGTFRMRL